MSEINHIKISLVLIPESYDYGIEDIVYRIYEKNQIIIERSMPQLNYNQAIVDTFFLSYDILKNCKQNSPEHEEYMNKLENVAHHLTRIILGRSDR